MKLVKIKKRYYTDMVFMFKDLGLVKNDQCDPSKVYCSDKDLEKFHKATYKLAKKKYPDLVESKIDFMVGMHMLDLSPNGTLGGVIKPGYLVIEE